MKKNNRYYWEIPYVIRKEENDSCKIKIRLSFFYSTGDTYMLLGLYDAGKKKIYTHMHMHAHTFTPGKKMKRSENDKNENTEYFG